MAKDKKKTKEDKKVVFEESVECKWCKKPNIIRYVKKTITPSTPAEIDKYIEVEKDTQKKLTD